MTTPPSPESSVPENKIKLLALLYETSNLLLKCNNAVYSEFGISHQQLMVLMAIESSNNPFIKITDVARKVKRNSNSISMIVDRMEKADLVKRVRDLPDRRSVHLLLTEKGKEKLYQASKVGSSLILQLTSNFSDDELKSFIHLVEKLRERSFTQLNPEKTIEDIKEPDIEMVERLLYKAAAD